MVLISFLKKSPPSHVLILESGKRKKKGTEMEQIDCTPPEHILPGSKERPLCPLQPQNRDWKVASVDLQMGSWSSLPALVQNASFHSPVSSQINPTFIIPCQGSPTKRQALIGQLHCGYFLCKFQREKKHWNTTNGTGPYGNVISVYCVCCCCFCWWSGREGRKDREKEKEKETEMEVESQVTPPPNARFIFLLKIEEAIFIQVVVALV